MINISQSPGQLTTQVTSNLSRVKYFPIELYCTNMVPNTNYDAYINGNPVNAFCKPYGGTLGTQLQSDATGKLRMQYMHSVQYTQQFLVNPKASNTNLIQSTLSITLIDPFNNSSTAKIPLLMKSS